MADQESSDIGNAIASTDESSTVDIQRIQEHRQYHRTTMILASQALVFGLAWLPRNILSLIWQYDTISSLYYSIVGQNLAHLVSMITHRFVNHINICPYFETLFRNGLSRFPCMETEKCLGTNFGCQEWKSRQTKYVQICSYCIYCSIAMTNNIANPLFYAWLNQTFRDLLANAIVMLRKGRGGNESLIIDDNEHENDERQPQTKHVRQKNDDNVDISSKIDN